MSSTERTALARKFCFGFIHRKGTAMATSTENAKNKNAEEVKIGAAESQTPALGKLHLEKNKLVGSFGKILDLRLIDLAPEFEYDMPDIVVSDDRDVEKIYIPNNKFYAKYILIENLPNLRQIVVCQDKESTGSCMKEIKWLVCKNLPKLESVKADGGLVWLEIVGALALKTVDVKNCKNLDFFSIDGSPQLDSIKIGGCIKLNKIENLTENQQAQLAIESQIIENQKKSRRDGKINKVMTATDVSICLNVMNEGLKIAARNGHVYVDPYVGDLDDLGYYGLDILRPNEPVYTGGTGDTYAYRSMTEGSETGNSSQEDCLSYLLHSIVQVYRFNSAGKRASADSGSLSEMISCNAAEDSECEDDDSVYEKFSDAQAWTLFYELIAEKNAKKKIAERKSSRSKKNSSTPVPSASTVKNSENPETRSVSRRFEFSDEKSAKFWEVSLADCTVTVCYGKIGTAGQTKDKLFPGVEEAIKHAEKLIREKTNKGYVESNASV
jgi:predicted DNA-binding WGR domain protein